VYLKKILKIEISVINIITIVYISLYVCILYRWPEDGHLRLRQTAASKDINIH